MLLCQIISTTLYFLLMNLIIIYPGTTLPWNLKYHYNNDISGSMFHGRESSLHGCFCNSLKFSALT